MTEPSDTTIAVCKCGGIVIAVVTDSIDREWRKKLMDAVMDGCSLRHVTAREVRETLAFGCRCAEVPRPVRRRLHDCAGR
jgi:tellurite resistance protein